MSVRTNSAAFSDLDKTIIAKSSVLAFGQAVLPRGSAVAAVDRRRACTRKVVFMTVGADEQKMEKLRVADVGDDANRWVDRAER